MMPLLSGIRWRNKEYNVPWSYHGSTGLDHIIGMSGNQNTLGWRQWYYGGRRRDHMVVEFTTTYAISAYRH